MSGKCTHQCTEIAQRNDETDPLSYQHNDRILREVFLQLPATVTDIDTSGVGQYWSKDDIFGTIKATLTSNN